MKRDPRQLRNGPFDVLVVGGGIYGSWMAYHAARTGLKVALVEQSDWGSATSSASSKLLHGGLRYLEQFEFGLVRKSLRERRELNRIMPHHVRPLRFLVPVYRYSRVGRWKMKAGLWLYDRLAGRHQPVGPHRSFSAGSLLETEPGLNPTDLSWGFSYGDCGTDDARMVLEVVETAMISGAVACNYIRAVELLKHDGTVVGAVLHDEETEDTFEVRSSLVVNACGPWVFSHSGTEDQRFRIRLTKGVHLVMPAMSSGQALLLTSQIDGRVFFLIPWYGRTLLGTTDTDFDGDPQSTVIDAEDVQYLLDSANHYLKTEWTTNDIYSAFSGVRTLQDESGKSASSVSRDWSVEETIPGLLTSIGGKFTSARVDAAAAVDRVLRILKRAASKLPPSEALAWHPGGPFYTWCDEIGRDATRTGIDPETATWCARRHGSHIAELFRLIEENRTLSQRIVPDLPFCRAEVILAVKSEMARNLIDILRRRIPLSLLTRLDSQTVDIVCQLAGDALNWNSARREQEVKLAIQGASHWRMTSSIPESR